MTVRSNSVDHLGLPDFISILKCISRRPAITHISLMSPFIIVVSHPVVKVDLQLLNALVDLFPESDQVKLLQYRLVEALADTVGLR